MPSVTTLNENTRVTLDGTEYIRLATSGANWKALTGGQIWVFQGIAGGIGVGSTLTLESTTGVGTSDAIVFKTASQVERMRIDTTGRCIFAGSSGGSLSINGAANYIQNWGVADADCDVSLGCFSSTASTASTIHFYHSKSGVLGSATAVASGDNLGGLIWWGAQQTGTFATQNMAARLRVEVDGTVTSGAGADMPGRMLFLTTPDGSGTAVERLRIDSAGRITTGASAALATWVATTLNPYLQVLGNSADTGAIGVAHFNSNATSRATINIAKSKNASIGSYTLSANDDAIGELCFQASSGTQFIPTAVFRAEVDSTGTPSSTSMPGRFRILTTPDGAVGAVEHFRIDQVGHTILSSAGNTSQAGLSSNEPLLQVHNSGAISLTGIYSWNSTNASGGELYLLKSRSNTVGTHTVVANGDTLGAIAWGGSDGTNFESACRIEGIVDGTPGNNDMPGKLSLQTTPDGSATLSERMRITNAGEITITDQAAGSGNFNSARIQLGGTSDNNVSMRISAYNSAAPSFWMLRSNNASFLGHTAVASGDVLGKYFFYGDDGSNVFEAAHIESLCDGTVSAGAVPGRLGFFTSTTGGVVTERVRINSAGACFFPSVGTTAGGGSGARLDNATSPANSLLRDTSSLRYKTAVRDLPAERVLALEALRPIEFRSLASADNPNALYVGYAAEEVAAIDPVLVAYDVEGRPDSVMYDRVNLLRTEALKLQLAEAMVRIAELEARMS